jgi:hypothetical protein
MNETVNLWKLFLLGFQILELKTGSNETPSFRQTKYCQTERQQILLTTSGYIFPLTSQ